MNKQEVDARVQAAIENLQSGRTVEDDTGIEFKREWPDPAKKARQLAGAANALRGDPLIYVIGVDDSSGAVTVPDKTEPQEWYAQIRKPFDQIPPELMWSQTVYFGEASESVLALVFDTSAFPYIINADNRREVPLRVASGTESAHRNQLVRMFEPALRAPTIGMASCVVSVEWVATSQPAKQGPPESVVETSTVDISLRAQVFIEHLGPRPITLPVRDMRARLVCRELDLRPEMNVVHLGETGHPVFIQSGEAPPPRPVPPTYGVYALDNHVVATSPGDFTISTKVGYRDRPEGDAEVESALAVFPEVDELRLDLFLRLVGVDRPVQLSTRLTRQVDMTQVKEQTLGQRHFKSSTLGMWTLPAQDVDPWA